MASSAVKNHEEIVKRAIRIVERGGSYITAAREIGGVSDWYLRQQPEVRAARARGNPRMFSQTHRTETIGCQIIDARRDIQLIERLIKRLLGEEYVLSLIDKRRLQRVLRLATNELEDHNER